VEGLKTTVEKHFGRQLQVFDNFLVPTEPLLGQWFNSTFLTHVVTSRPNSVGPYFHHDARMESCHSGIV
jgi:hypothetical protein